jgi:hypothetical protein
MKGTLQIKVDLEAGEVWLGAQRVRLLPPTRLVASGPSRAGGDVFQLNSPQGPTIRTLSFKERSLLLADVPDCEIASRIAEAALIAPGDVSDLVRVAVSLALAGGGEQGPSFSDCALSAAQRYGWDQQRVGETMALLVDRQCGNPSRPSSDGGWKRIIFQEPEPDLEKLVSLMVQNLRQRSGSDATDQLEPETTATADESKATSCAAPSQASHSANVGAQTHQVQAANFDTELDRATPSHSTITPGPHSLPVQQSPSQPASQSTSSNPQVARHDSEPHRPAASQISISKTVVASPSTLPHGVGPVSAPFTPFRISARVLPLKSDDLRRTRTSVLTSSPGISDLGGKTTIGYSSAEHFKTSAVPLKPPTTNQPGLVLSQVVSAVREQPVSALKSLASPTLRQSFPSLAAEAKATRSASETENCAESPSTSEWLAELALLLEAECDMRGIDP